ncbi:MAG: hypothetical protein R2854_14340 [Caldilineaceae bacterium]
MTSSMRPVSCSVPLLAYVLYELADLIVVIFVALIFASTVRPILRGMARRHIPQWLSILIIYAGTALGSGRAHSPGRATHCHIDDGCVPE